MKQQMEMILTFSAFTAAILLQGIFATGFSDVWAVIHENSECHLVDGMEFKTISDTKDVTYCASMCTTNDKCKVFEYDSTNAKCRLFNMSVPHQPQSVACTSGHKVYSYRRWKEDCSGPGYLYEEVTGLCISFTLDQSKSYKWDDAKELCEAKNESFLSVDSISKLNIIKNIIRNRPDLDLISYHLGGRKTDGIFKWVNGEDMQTSTYYWNEDPALKPTFECVAINRWFYNFKYQVQDCDTFTTQAFFCEKIIQ